MHILKIKKILFIILGVVVFNLFFVQNVFAASGVVTGNTVRVRKEASTTSEIVTNVYKNDKIEAIELIGEWYKVKANNKEGYIHKDYIDVKEIITSTETAKVEETKEEVQEENAVNNVEEKKEEVIIPENTEKVITKDTGVYLVPIITSTQMDDLLIGKKVMALETLNGWINISYDGKSGWIRVSSLIETEKQEGPAEEEDKKPEPVKKEEINQETPKEEKQTSKFGYISATTVNIRKEPNTSSTILDQLDKKEKIEILSTANGWHKIKVNGITGYVSASLVVDKLEDIVSRSGETTTRPVEKVEETGKAEEVIAKSTPQILSSRGEEVVNYAKTFLQVKYVSGGNGPTSFDCSGYTCYVYKNFGVSLARTTGGQATAGVEVAKKDLQLGDIVVFNDDANKKIGHVGIYVGNNSFIHASNPNPYPKGGVKITSLSDSYYELRYVTSRRVI